MNTHERIGTCANCKYLDGNICIMGDNDTATRVIDKPEVTYCLQWNK